MKTEKMKIGNIPATLWGSQSENVYLFVHGQGGSKEDAQCFAGIVTEQGFQVLSIDLPGYGERKAELANFDPWHAVPELTEVMKYIRSRWSKVGLFANSIGAWFSMLSFKEESFIHCLFLSPILDMNRLISNMMKWSGVTEELLKEKQVIPTDFGQTLYWDYYQYAKNNPIETWPYKTSILYGTEDNLTEYETVKEFATRFKCDLLVMKDGEHWFHTKEQLEVMENWIKESRKPII